MSWGDEALVLSALMFASKQRREHSAKPSISFSDTLDQRLGSHQVVAIPGIWEKVVYFYDDGAL